ncbi:MAG: DinB family protein [Phycisphaerales bacterium]|nr:DinB family protein [Planctomycetota bacterium]MCH8507356.1 DinB family protein [Phycisphaerales bacterium]
MTPTLELTLPDLEQIRALDADTLVSRLRIGVEHFDPRVFELTDEQLDQAWLPDAGAGRWPIRVLLGHLADAEIVNAHRIRRAFGENNPTLAVWDEDAFIDSGLYGCTEASAFRPPIGGDVAAIHTTRSWMVAMLYQFEADHWQRRALHPERGPITIRDIADYNCWHLEQHAAYLNAKVFRMLGPAPEPEACSPAGCARPGCACAQPND